MIFYLAEYTWIFIRRIYCNKYIQIFIHPIREIKAIKPISTIQTIIYQNFFVNSDLPSLTDDLVNRPGVAGAVL